MTLINTAAESYIDFNYFNHLIGTSSFTPSSTAHPALIPPPSNALSQFAITTSLLAYRPFSKLTSYSLLSLRALFSISPAAIGIAKRNNKKCLCKILEGQQKVLWHFFQQGLFSVASKILSRSCFFGNEIIWT